MKKLSSLLALALFVHATTFAETSDVVVTAKENGCSAFYEAVMQTGLYEQAKKEVGADGSLAPFTVFAPTNEALEPLKKLDAKAQKHLLMYHVVPSKKIEKPLEDLKDGAPTVGEKLLKASGQSLFLDESDAKASIVKGPFTASNGLVYVIDALLTPAGQALPIEHKQPEAKEAEKPKPVEKPAEKTVEPAKPASTSTQAAAEAKQTDQKLEKTIDMLNGNVLQLTQSIQLLTHVIQQAQQSSIEDKNTPTPVVVN